MTLQTSGPITLDDIALEFEHPNAGGGGPVLLSEFYSGGAYVGVGTTGNLGAVIPDNSLGKEAISLADFYGASNIVPGDFFESGTTTVFRQTSAPTGWTKLTTRDDVMLRVVSGTPIEGGTQSFTTTFSQLTPNVSVYTLTLAHWASHNHYYPDRYPTGSNDYDLESAAHYRNNSTVYDNTYATNSVGRGGGIAWQHGHTATSLGMDIAYVDIIQATKD